MDRTLEYGARQAIETCAQVKPDEQIVIITDAKTRRVGDALQAVARKVTERVTLFLMEDFGARPEHGVGSLRLPEEISSALREADVSFYAAQEKKGESESFRAPLMDLVRGTPRLRHAHMPGITEDIMRSSMALDYRKVQYVTGKVGEVFARAEIMHVTTLAGTNLEIELSPDRTRFICDAVPAHSPERWSRLPGGEVFTYPRTAYGTMVVDGVLGDYFATKYGLLVHDPVRIEVVGGRAIGILCGNKQLLRELENYLSRDRNADRMGESRIGTNIGLTGIVGNLIQDEKFPGNHNVFGTPDPPGMGFEWSSKAHMGCIMRYCTITLDGRTIMREGNFTDEILGT